MRTAAQQWREDLASWAIPDDIRAQAHADPWKLTPRLFPADPPGADGPDPARDRAREALESGDSVLDVGAGGGRAGFAVVPPGGRLTAVDESAEMLAAVSARALTLGIDHEVVQGRWPDVAPSVGVADVVVSHHVIYNVADLGEFATALTEHARRRVVVEFGERHPVSGSNYLWKHFWGIDRPQKPVGDDVLAVLAEVGIVFEVERATVAPRRQADDEAWIENLTRRLCLAPDRTSEVAELVRSRPEGQPRDIVIAWWCGGACP